MRVKKMKEAKKVSRLHQDKIGTKERKRKESKPVNISKPRKSEFSAKQNQDKIYNNPEFMRKEEPI